jgi:outer membrane protein assembly factor BamB
MSTRNLIPRVVALCSVAGIAALGPVSVSAQPIEAGVNAVPSALVLLDTSASMEWLETQDEYPLCLTSSGDYPGYAQACPGGTDAECALGMFCGSAGTCEFARSRYHAAVEVLTGSIPGYYPICDDRTSDPLRLDQFGGNPNQGIRHSIACSYTGLPGASILNECYRTPNGAVIEPANFVQQPDGLVDLYGQFVHFGFMAYDSFPDPRETAAGMYSYGIEGWSPTPGANPIACPNNTDCWNLGGRRPGTGVQGATVPPIDPAQDDAFRRQQINNEVQRQVRSVVPYWSTPIEGILEDALTLYTGGDTDSYSWYAANAGYATDAGAYDYSRGLTDPYGVCRDRYVILITDGLATYNECIRRGFAIGTDPWDSGCEGYWYADADYYAARLLDAGVRTFVIAFNLVVPDGFTDPLTSLESIAASGGTSQVYFADGSRELLFQLGDILTQIAEGTPSRTRPVSTNQLAGDRLGQYRFEASFNIEQESKYWSGNLIRSGRECEDGALVDGTPLAAGDLIDARPLPGGATTTGVRKFYTASPAYHSCAIRRSGDPFGSLFGARTVELEGGVNPLVEAYGVTDVEINEACRVEPTATDPSPDQDACYDLTDGEVGFVVEINERDEPTDDRCMVRLDVDDVTDDNFRVFGGARKLQSEMFVRWLQGYRLTELRDSYLSELTALLPANFRYDPDTGSYPRDRTGRMGDVFHSAPAFVGRPDPFYSTDEDYVAFAEAQADRASTIYVGTNDGLLHAFDAETMEERWSFLPGYFLPRIGEWIVPGHTFMFDGTPQIADIAFTRTLVDDRVQSEWGSVLVSGYRGGGRGYVALDVTNPVAPKWLWELDATLDPQLGLTYGEPDIGTVLLSECIEDPNVPCERGIVVLPGGLPPEGADPNTNVGRVLYVLDLKTGTVLRRFTEFRNADGDDVPFVSPVSGSIALFDGFGGTVVSRGFFGDRDGLVYRVDLASGDPADWRVDLFFDPNDSITPELGLAAGETIEYGEVRFKPTIATYNDYRAVVVYGMGDPDKLDDLGARRNFVVSAIETPVFAADGTLESIRGDLNWAVELEEYEKMTARPRIFNRQTYIATFVPDATDLCEIGGARLYAFDYVGVEGALPGEAIVSPPNCADFRCSLVESPIAPFDPIDNPLVPYWDTNTQIAGRTPFIPPKSILYSLEIVQAPSCFLEESFDSGTRGGSSAGTRITAVDEGAYELQIGVSSYTEDTAGGVPVAVSQIQSVELERPPVAAIPTSWTLIFE